MEFEFGAAFTPIRSIPLRTEPGERLAVTDLLSTASGLFWVADARAGELKVYSQEGRRVRTLRRDATGQRRPISLASLHGRWIAALDGGRPLITILDESGRKQRYFRLPEIDRPYQLCNLGDRLLAVIGRGWKLGAGRVVHFYDTSGKYIESLFGEPGGAVGVGRPYAAAIGHVLYLADSRTDSFTTYDLRDCGVLSFPRLLGGMAEGDGHHPGPRRELRGLFVTGCFEVVAMSVERGGGSYLYDLYALSGTPIALGLRTPERVVGLEGSLFYSVRATPGGDTTLTVWKLSYSGSRSQNAGVAVGNGAQPG